MGLNIKTLEKYNNVHLHAHEYQGNQVKIHHKIFESLFNRIKKAPCFDCEKQ